MRQKQPISFDVALERDGKRYSGSYTVESGVVTVHFPPWGTKATQIGNSSADRIARLLLSELVTEHLK
jgi:hypothetical protein